MQVLHRPDVIENIEAKMARSNFPAQLLEWGHDTLLEGAPFFRCRLGRTLAKLIQVLYEAFPLFNQAT